MACGRDIIDRADEPGEIVMDGETARLAAICRRDGAQGVAFDCLWCVSWCVSGGCFGMVYLWCISVHFIKIATIFINNDDI